jgi:glycosyltransferase involved in cell wall biosynthesis
MPTGGRVNIIYGDNGSGLTRDAAVLREALDLAGYRVWLTPRAPRKFPLSLNYAPELIRQLVRSVRDGAVKTWARRARFWDINIFIESLVPDYFECAKVNALFPHQEWLTADDRRLLNTVDIVLFKTRHAMDLLGGETKNAAFVGFTSFDQLDRRRNHQPAAALHVSGWNPQKGTTAVLNAWSKHREWPHLTVVSQLDLERAPSSNVTYLSRRVSNSQLRRLQNDCAFHICPSEVEGFGHTLVEGLSCGAIIVTTDAPPMNELVSSDEGVLVPYTSTAEMASGIRYLVDPERLAEALDELWSLDDAAKQRRHTAARRRYETMRGEFHAALARTLNDL